MQFLFLSECRLLNLHSVLECGILSIHCLPDFLLKTMEVSEFTRCLESIRVPVYINRNRSSLSVNDTETWSIFFLHNYCGINIYLPVLCKTACDLLVKQKIYPHVAPGLFLPCDRLLDLSVLSENVKSCHH